LFLKHFSKDGRLWIFGSRIDETKRGGDIDLYIEVSIFDFDKVYRARSNFWIDLQDQLGEQKIDIVIKDPGKNLEIYQEARSSGIKLV
jgi:predicted nucleotidyltransferase